MRRLQILAICAALLACAHSQKPATAEAAPPEPVAQPAPPPVVAPAPTPAPEAKPAEPAVVAEVPAASLYFAFDKYYLNEDSRAALDKLAVGASAPGTKVRIEGNCDERGSVEYNIGLGQRRADAAKKYLVDLGVSAEGISTISYGKERPKMLGHDEESWRENRRDDVFIIPAPKISQR